MADVASINRALDQYYHTYGTMHTTFVEDDVITGWVSRFCYYYMNNTSWSSQPSNIIAKFEDGAGHFTSGYFYGTDQIAQGGAPGFVPEDTSVWTLGNGWLNGISANFYAGGQGLMTKFHDCQSRKLNDSTESSGGTGIDAAGNGAGTFKQTNIKMGDFIGFNYSRTTAWPKADAVNETITANASTGALSMGLTAI